jgi:hypothetical protein
MMLIKGESCERLRILAGDYCGTRSCRFPGLLPLLSRTTACPANAALFDLSRLGVDDLTNVLASIHHARG